LLELEKTLLEFLLIDLVELLILIDINVKLNWHHRKDLKLAGPVLEVRADVLVKFVLSRDLYMPLEVICNLQEVLA
jgi:hypothetical protein